MGVIHEDLQPFKRHASELITESGCILWGCRVVIPESQRPTLPDLEACSVWHLGEFVIWLLNSWNRIKCFTVMFACVKMVGRFVDFQIG